MYWLVLVCTSTYQEFLDSKKVQTGFEPVILCIPLHILPLDCGCSENEFGVSIYPNVGVYNKLVLFMSLYLALDDELTAPDPLHRPHLHDVHSADLDWNLTPMAQPSTATGLGM